MRVAKIALEHDLTNYRQCMNEGVMSGLRFILMMLVPFVSQSNADDELQELLTFRTPIASDAKDAVRQTIIESFTLPRTFETYLYSTDRMIKLRVDTVDQKARTVGRNISLNLPSGVTEEAIKTLLREACSRIPYSGWRENAELLGSEVPKLWTEFQLSTQDNRKLKWEVIPTELYTFHVKLTKGSEISISNLTGGIEDLYDETMKDLRTSLAIFAPHLRRNENGELVLIKDAWFIDEESIAKLHQTVIEKADDRWPVAIHFRFAVTQFEWSSIIAEQSVFASDRSELSKYFEQAVLRIPPVNGEPIPVDLIAIPNDEGDKAIMHKNWQLIVSRRTIENMNQIEIRFRKRSVR